MRRPLLLLILLLLIPAVHARGLTEVRTPALVELDTDPPSWLFGTIHVPDPRVTNLHPDVLQALEQADAVLITGGLGPTKDDLTPRALADFFGDLQ